MKFDRRTLLKGMLGGAGLALSAPAEAEQVGRRIWPGWGGPPQGEIVTQRFDASMDTIILDGHRMPVHSSRPPPRLGQALCKRRM